MRVSYLEIYIEEVRDLLSKPPRKKLEIRERTDIGVYVKDLTTFVVKNADEMDKLMSIGSSNSQCDSHWYWIDVYNHALYEGTLAATGMNDLSSRSHVIFTIIIEQSELGADKQQHVRMGKLHLVDLAVRRTTPSSSPV